MFHVISAGFKIWKVLLIGISFSRMVLMLRHLVRTSWHDALKFSWECPAHKLNVNYLEFYSAVWKTNVLTKGSLKILSGKYFTAQIGLTNNFVTPVLIKNLKTGLRAKKEIEHACIT